MPAIASKTLSDPACVRGKLVVASSDPKLIAAVLELCRAEGFQAFHVTDSTAAIEAAKQHRPDCLYIDAALRGVDPGKIVRILQRFGPTKCCVSILIAPESISPLRLQQMESLGALCVLQRPFNPYSIKAAFGAAIRRSCELKKIHEPPAAKTASPTRRVDGNNSLLARQVACPFHDEPVTFDRFLLRTGRILTDVSFFDLPVYKAPVGDADFVNYHLLNVAVCPRCLFATNNPEYLLDPGVKPHAHSSATRQAIISGFGERRDIAAHAGSSLFTEHRDEADAEIAYRLAIHCSETIFNCNRHTLTMELLRLGNYHLRLAYLYEQQNPANDLREAELAKALQWLKQAFTVLSGPALYKAAYQTIALAIAFGDDKTAYPYLTSLQNLRNEPGLSPEGAGALDRYIARAKSAWENREDQRLPSVQAQAA